MSFLSLHASGLNIAMILPILRLRLNLRGTFLPWGLTKAMPLFLQMLSPRKNSTEYWPGQKGTAIVRI